MKMKWNKQKIKYGLRRLFLLILSAATVCVMALPVLAMTQVEAELPFTVEGASGTVRIEAEDGAPLPEVTEFTGEGTGKFTMQYTEPDDYVYRVYQLPGGETDVTYDETEYRVLVSVIVNDDGNLIPRITLATEGSVQKPAEIGLHAAGAVYWAVPGCGAGDLPDTQKTEKGKAVKDAFPKFGGGQLHR